MRIRKLVSILFTSLSLVGFIGIMGEKSIEVVDAVKLPPVPKPLKGNWYNPGENDVKMSTKVMGWLDPGFNTVEKKLYMKTAKWKKLGKNRYEIVFKGQALVEHGALKTGTIINYYTLKKINYDGKKYRVIIKHIKNRPNRRGFVHLGYCAMFNRLTSKKIAKGILKKLHLRKKVLKSAIKYAERF